MTDPNATPHSIDDAAAKAHDLVDGNVPAAKREKTHDAVTTGKTLTTRATSAVRAALDSAGTTNGSVTSRLKQIYARHRRAVQAAGAGILALTVFNILRRNK